MIDKLKIEIIQMAEKSIFYPDVNALSIEDWKKIIEIFEFDYKKYYNSEINFLNLKYYPGLLATLFYRISRHLFIIGNEKQALEFSCLGTFLTSIELYYSAEIGKGLKINHGIGTVVGSRTKIGDNVLLHHTVTIGEKNGGRAQIGNNVVIYPGAIIVGAIFIDDNSIIGANMFVDKSYPKNSKIL